MRLPPQAKKFPKRWLPCILQRAPAHHDEGDQPMNFVQYDFQRHIARVLAQSRKYLGLD